MATVELAYNAENKEFMAHAACQKWVTRQFYGEITPRELSWGLFKCPDYLKVKSSGCSCTFFYHDIDFDCHYRLFQAPFSFFPCGFGLIFPRSVKLHHHRKNLQQWMSQIKLKANQIIDSKRNEP